VAEVKDSLEEKLKAVPGPEMPAEVEARIRKRLMAETPRHPPGKALRFAKRVPYGQLVLLMALLLTAGWVLQHEVAPVLRAAWERVHCLVETPQQPKH
jgi:hypothetical protein